MAFDGSGLLLFLFGVLVGLLIAPAVRRWWRRLRRWLSFRAESDFDQPFHGGHHAGWGSDNRPRTPEANNIAWLDFGLDRNRPGTIPVSSQPSVEPVARPIAPTGEAGPPTDTQTLAVRLYGADVEEFRRRFRPQVVEPDRQRLDSDPDDVLVHEQSDGSYWLISLQDRVGLVFPRPNRAFGRGMMQYAAAPFLFDIQGFQEGFRYRRSIVHAPVRMSPEGDGWRRHTRGVLEVLDGEPDE